MTTTPPAHQGRPTPATRLMICSRCGAAEWHVPVVGEVIVHGRCRARMRDATAAEARADRARARARPIRPGDRVAVVTDPTHTPALAALGTKLDGTVTRCCESSGAVGVRLDLQPHAEVWVPPERLIVQLTRAPRRGF